MPRKYQRLLLWIIALVIVAFIIFIVTDLNPTHQTYLVLTQCIPLFCSCSSTTKPLKLMIQTNSSIPTICGSITCAEKYLRYQATAKLHKNHKYPIPPVRHILWKSDLMSDYFLRQLKTWVKVHPDWTYVLWRDEDLDLFVQKYFPGKVWQKFDSLPKSGPFAIFRIDMVLYLILYQFGGVYADMDYSLLRNLTWHRQFPNVITREPEAHSAMMYGFEFYPLPVLANAAFLMSRPKSEFMRFCIEQIINRCFAFNFIVFAGPMGLSHIMETYQQRFPKFSSRHDFVFIPDSFSFHPYPNNSLYSGKSDYLRERIELLNWECYKKSVNVNAINNYCKDVSNLNWLTNTNHSIIAVHDLNKEYSIYIQPDNKQFTSNKKSVKSEIWYLKFGNEFSRRQELD